MDDDDLDQDAINFFIDLIGPDKTNAMLKKHARRKKFKPCPIRLRPWERVLHIIALPPVEPIVTSHTMENGADYSAWEHSFLLETYREAAKKLLQKPKTGKNWERKAQAICQEYVMTTEIVMRQAHFGGDKPEH